ncbi:unnamed protein product [Sphagnum troendelagicum]|uniref:Patatin n=1 Tax=Sphagnum troendelagicum TaxID=128251 RepID=A0ABP0UL39_9BRYO
MAFDENLNSNETNGKTRKRLAILSIDGGGVRGVIPAQILEVLEGYLQRAEGVEDEKAEDKSAVYAEDKNAGESKKTRHDLWEYFDIIAGTSSGGLITALITIPVHIVKDQPARTYNANQVVAFFDEYAETIFPERFTGKPWFHLLWDGIVSIFRNVYDAGPLENRLHRTFGEARLSRALTSVIIPAFDTKKQRPVLFSDLKGVDEANPLYNVYVKDACRATTAVPILFPPAVVEEQVSADPKQPGRSEVFNVIDGGIAVNDPVGSSSSAVVEEQVSADQKQPGSSKVFNVIDGGIAVNDPVGSSSSAVVEEQVSADQKQPGSSKVFNVIDGGIAVNDPTLVAVIQAIMQERHAIEEDEKEIANKRSRDCKDIRDVLVLSLGTGQHPMRFIANPHWSSVQWLLNRSGSPLLSSFLSASEYMVEYYTSRISNVHQSHPHYLRIQCERLLESEILQIDDAEKKNLKRLKDAAAALVNTNYREALYSFAELLVHERRKLQESTVQPGEGESKFGRTRRSRPLDENKEQGVNPLRGGRQQPHQSLSEENKEQAEALRDGAAPSTAGAVQTAVNGRCLRMRTAVRGCCSKMGATLAVVCFAAFWLVLYLFKFVKTAPRI